MGLPLGEVVDSNQTRFEDRLDLDPMRYYYSVVPLDADGVEMAPGPPLAVDVTRVITEELAVARGLVPSGTHLAEGDAVRLALHPFGTGLPRPRSAGAVDVRRARVAVHRHRRAVFLRADRHSLRQHRGLSSAGASTRC